MRDLADVVVDHGSQTKKFGVLLWRWHNAAHVDTAAQNPDLRLQQLKMNVVPQPEPLQSKSQDRVEEAIHGLSFRSAKPAKHPIRRTWGRPDATFEGGEGSVTIVLDGQKTSTVQRKLRGVGGQEVRGRFSAG